MRKAVIPFSLPHLPKYTSRTAMSAKGVPETHKKRPLPHSQEHTITCNIGLLIPVTKKGTSPLPYLPKYASKTAMSAEGVSEARK